MQYVCHEHDDCVVIYTSNKYGSACPICKLQSDYEYEESARCEAEDDYRQAKADFEAAESKSIELEAEIGKLKEQLEQCQN